MTATGSKPIDDAHPLCRMSAESLIGAYAARRLSPVDVAVATIARAETVQTRFNAFTRIDRAAALKAARASEDRWRLGEPLSRIDGVPATIKDIVTVAGWPLRAGSFATAEEPCPADAPAVARLRMGGAVLIGLTTTPEYGWKAVTDGPLSGVTRNPWDATLTPGGSSGGAAAAAVAGAGVLHLGTDGGGSIRIPASFTGIVGLKPTFGRVPAYPASPFGTLAHLGPMTRRVGDLRAMLAAMAGTDPRDWQQGPAVLPPLGTRARSFAGARIGFWSTPPCGAVDPAVVGVIAGTMGHLAGLGALVEPVELPAGDWLDTFRVLWFAGAAARVASLPPNARAKLDPGLQAMAAEGAAFSAVRHIQAMAARAELGRAMEVLAARFDILVSPAVAVLPFAAGAEVPPGSGLGRWVEWAGFSFPANLSQQPAMVVPAGRTGEGLPVGLQIIAPRGEDARVLDYAEAFETAFPTLFV